jgi:hypothetical protein
LLPLVVLFAAFFLFDFLFGLAASRVMIGPMSILVVAVAYGILLPQAGLLCLIGGLASRSWVKGFAIASLLGCGLVLCLLADSILRLDWDDQVLPALSVVPNGILAGAAPLLLYRAITGRCLTRSPVQTSGRRPGLEALFVVTSVIAAVQVLANVLQRQFSVNGQDVKLMFWMGFLAYGAAFFIASSVAVLPVTICYFTARDQGARTRWLWGFAGLSLFAIMGFMVVLGALYGSQAEVFVFTGVFCLTSSALFSVGLIVLRASGFRLSERISNHSATAAADVSGKALAADSLVIEKPSAASALPFTKSDDLVMSGPDAESTDSPLPSAFDDAAEEMQASKTDPVVLANRYWAAGLIAAACLISLAALAINR